MWHGLRRTSAAALIAAIALLGHGALAQTSADPNSAPNPYRLEENWAKTAMGRPIGAAIGVDIDRDGKSVWVYDRCGGRTCVGSKIAPIMKFDADGRLVAAFGAELVNDPHGLYVDRDDNIWVTDYEGKNKRGHTVIKLSSTGQVLMTLGKPGVAGDGPDTFNQPSDVVVAPNGDIFVADGHGGKSNGRIVKFSKNGQFIRAWGKPGKAQGEFDTPHSIALDSAGRVFVGDRSNNRIQVFDPIGNFLAEWKQFGRPSGVFIDKHDVLYVADSQSTDTTNPGFRQGIRIGSVKDGRVSAFIPIDRQAPEAVAVDDQGIIYAGYTTEMHLRRFIKK